MPGWTQTINRYEPCNVDIDECTTNLCMNNATCTNTNGAYFSSCLSTNPLTCFVKFPVLTDVKGMVGVVLIDLKRCGSDNPNHIENDRDHSVFAGFLDFFKIQTKEAN